MKMRYLTLLSYMLMLWLGASGAQASDVPPLKLLQSFGLSSDVSGRFDHFAADPQHNRLFVVLKEYKAVLALDLGSGKVLHSIDHLGEPQGVLYRADIDTIYIADGAHGTVEIIDGTTYRSKKSLKLRLNADSIAFDGQSGYLYVVNGGADAKMTQSFISVIDTKLGKTVKEIPVDGDTLEAMALEKATSIMYVDNRAKNEVDVIDRQTDRTVAVWPITLGETMVSLALDEAGHRLFIGCRDGSVVVVDTVTGKEAQALSIGQGLDDLVFDVASRRLYAACGGSGTVDVYEETDPDHYRSLGKIPSGPLARNGLLIPDLKQYVVGVPKDGNKSAAILVYDVH
jgi:DNA-binding beta-propeller fold protein YncE